MDGHIVGTTTGCFNVPESGDRICKSGTLHMVSVTPQTNGMGVGKVPCSCAMVFLFDHGCEEIVLTTDDFRLPAIKNYLDLGFQPVIKRGMKLKTRIARCHYIVTTIWAKRQLGISRNDCTSVESKFPPNYL